MLHVMIMAGGKGSRFWPMSREKKAKQFLSIIGDQPLIDTTLDRIESITEPQQRWILGNHRQTEQLQLLTKRVPKSNILEEPFGKNTAACIGWGAFEALKQDPDAICAILSADAWIDSTELFQETLAKAVAEVEANNSVVTIGIPPKSAHTGYGYIQVDDPKQQICSVCSFKEKPNTETAKQYLDSPNYFWNAGIFIWKASTIAQLFKEYLPDHYRILKEYTDKGLQDPEAVTPYYEQLESISIDYGIMEHISDQLKLIPASFEWNDIGSWAALEEYLTKDEANNAYKGKLITSNSSNNIVFSEKKLIALANVDDLIIVDSDDALLIMPKSDDQAIKSVYEKLSDDYT